MPSYIIKLKDKYAEWSTIVDAPVSPFLSLEQFKEYYQYKYGQEGMLGLPERLERVETKGCSALNHDSVKELISFNAAGKGETHLDVDELLEAYQA